MQDETGKLIKEAEKTRKAPAPFKFDIKYLLNKTFFPHLKNRGKREYISLLITRSSTYLAISYGTAILFGTLLYFLKDIFYITTLVWSPEELLVLPFMFTFIEDRLIGADQALTLITNYIVTIILPFLIAGIISGMVWRSEAKDLVLISSFFTFVLFLLLHLSQVLLFTSFSNVYAAISTSFLYYGFVFIFGLSFLIFSALGGYLGVQFGQLLSNIRIERKGAKISYSHLLLPEMPYSAKTIFDLDKPIGKLNRQSISISMVYLSHRVNKILKKAKYDHCVYFNEGRCAYLGYLTAQHKYQVCLTEYWPVCRVYAFLNQSKMIFAEANEGEKNG